jgi:hypothetical protein
MKHALALAALALSFSPIAFAQVVKSVTPVVADPGDTIVLTGTNLAGVDDVAFVASVGGFVGIWTVHVAPTSTSATEVVVVVPQINAFTPPQATPPGQLVGTIVASAGASSSAPVDFGFLESTFNEVRTLGVTGSDPIGFTPQIAFTLAGGIPKSPNPSFVATVTGQPSASFTYLVVGPVAPAPYLPLFGGELRIDPLVWYQLLPGTPSPSTPGAASRALSIPPGFDGVRVAMQWLSLDPLTLQSSLSDALIVRL